MQTESINSSLHGIHAAIVCPMDHQANIIDHELARHAATVSKAPGIRGLLVNGHAGEGALLTHNERIETLKVVKSTITENCHICAGIFGESTADAIAAARNAADAGADSVLVFPPNAWALGHDSHMATLHHRAIAEACSLPMLLYRAPLAAGKMSYSTDTLRALITIDSVSGIKEGSWEVSAYEEAKRLVQAIRPEIAVLGSGDEHLLTCYAIGTVGSQVSLAAIVPKLVIDLFDAMSKGDLESAKALNHLVYPLAGAIYRRAPGYRATPRLKTCLMILDRLSCDTVKAPNLRSDAEERRLLESLLNRPEYSPYL